MRLLTEGAVLPEKVGFALLQMWLFSGRPGAVATRRWTRQAQRRELTEDWVRTNGNRALESTLYR